MKKHTHRAKKRLEPKRMNTHVQSKKTKTKNNNDQTHTGPKRMNTHVIYRDQKE